MSLNTNFSLNPLELKLFDILTACFLETPNRKSCDTIYIFGGWVRDKLLSRSATDYDIMVPKAIIKSFLAQITKASPRASIKSIALDEYPKIGQTLYNVKLKDLNVKMGVTPLEIDLEHELNNKDFTVNSLCYDVVRKALVRNRVTARGMADLESRVLRTNSNPETTFRQAPSRIVRMVRFSLEYQLTVADNIARYFANNKLRSCVKYYNNSFMNQLRKLARYVDTEKTKVSGFLRLIAELKILDFVTLWFDYRVNRIVVFFIKYDLDELKNMMKRDQMVIDDHYTSIRLPLKELAARHQEFIQIKNSGNLSR